MDDSFLLYGSAVPLPEPIALRAGPLTMLYEHGSLRRIRLGSQAVLLMIYAAVRDHNWSTIVGELSEERLDVRPASFEISYLSRHRRDDIDFSWRGRINGAEDGAITFSFEGEAHSSFLRNRIGFCVLHAQDCAGSECEIEHSDGTIEGGRFPQQISPHQPFKDMRAISHALQDGLKARVSFEGDVFEMEDQRNWSDASFKTYCTPLERPYPARVEQGQRVRQSVRLELVGAAPASTLADEPGEVVVARTGAARRLPPVGLCMPAQPVSLGEVEVERLRALNLAHLRVDARFSDHDANASAYEAFQSAASAAKSLALPLEIALTLTDDAARQAGLLANWIDSAAVRVARFLVYHHKLKTTTARWVELARSILGRFRAPVGAGSDAFFTEINRYRPPVDALDFVSYSINPQMHAFDNLTLVENLAAQRETVRSALAISGGRAVVVGPVTLKMRWNPDAFAPYAPPPAGELPRPVDARQMSLFGAGWTLGSLQALAESGASSLTYYEILGWLGVMETQAGPPLPEKFPSISGGVYPVYHLFADVGAFAGGEVLAVRSSDAIRVAGLLLRKQEQHRLLLANLTAQVQVVRCADVSGPATVRLLDGSNARRAMHNAEAFRAEPGQPLSGGEDGVVVELSPFALATLDW